MSDTEVVGDPWERLGWLLWAPWMVFLVFPLVAAWQQGPGLDRALGVGSTVLFAATYAVGMHLLARGGCSRPWGQGHRYLTLALLVALPLLAAPALGLGALGFVPFVQAFAVFTLPTPQAWWVAGAVLGTVVAVLTFTASFEEWGYFVFILFAVTVGTGVGRLMEEQGERYAEVRNRLTVTAERERVARDVHDVLGHSLTVVSVKADLAARLLDVDPARARAEMEDVQRLSRQALAEIRATVGGLRAAPLSEEVAAAREALDGAGIAADLPADEQEIDPRYRAVVGWVLREAVTNVVRHSGAARCTVRLHEAGLSVLDDGRGVAGAAEGNGLRGLRERVEASGGSLRLGSGPDGRGTCLEVAW